MVGRQAPPTTREHDLVDRMRGCVDAQEMGAVSPIAYLLSEKRMELTAKWWHRLIAAMLFLGGLTVALIAGAIAYDSSSISETHYGWRSDKLGAFPVDCTITVVESSRYGFAYCGGMMSAQDILDDMIERNIVSVRSGERSEFEDARALKKLSGTLDLRFSNDRVLSGSKAAKNFGLAAAALFVYALFAYALFSGFLWIAHGRIRLDRW